MAPTTVYVTWQFETLHFHAEVTIVPVRSGWR